MNSRVLLNLGLNAYKCHKCKQGIIMNKKIILIFSLILAVFLMSSAVYAEGFFDFFSNDNSGAVNDDKTFTVGFSDVFPPFGYKTDDGNYTGFDYELAKEVAKRNNWTFKPHAIIGWDTKEDELNSNAIDCIWSEFTIDGREDKYTWSDPYFNNSQVIVVKNDSNINSFADLKGKSVELLFSSSAENLVDENKSLMDSFAKVDKISDYNTGFMDLESGACDALIVDVGCAKYHIAQKFSNSNFKILDKPIKYDKYGIAFKKGNDGLRNQVQKTLDEMFKDGTVDKIAQNYSDYGIPERVIHP